MTTINVSNLILKLQQKIDSSTNEADLLYYAKAMQQLRSGMVYAVNNISELPNAVQNPGALYYVRNDETVYFSSEFGWSIIISTSINPIFSWGLNTNGRLGDGTTVNKCSPVREISSATDWCGVSAGGYHTAAIKTTGQLWSWGRGLCGALGDGTVTDRCSPVREISSSTDWCQVSTGNYHTAAVKTSGQIWAWGNNACGSLGDGTTVARCSPVREFCSATDWCQVSAGSTHTAAVKTSGQIWAWGNNACGRLGDGTTVPRCSPVRERCSATDWCGVSVGNAHTAAIKTSGQIWAWGNNGSGRLGDGTTVVKCSPVRERCSATDWCGVSAGGYHTAAIKTTGQIWSWGSNTCGRLGDGTTVGRCSPVRERCSATDWCGVSGGRYHAAAIKTTGQIWAWGGNSIGQLGDGTTTDRCSPVREISSSTDWCRVSAGSLTTAAIKIKYT
jgi:alpha-tubulin suppressor-like RCC1 family protein